MNSALPVPEKLDLRSENRSKKWENFHQKWNNYEIASGLSDKTEEVKLATLLTVIGDDALTVYNTFKLSNGQKNVSTVLSRFKEYCAPETNEIYNRYILMSRKQEQNESIDDYVLQLETLADKCNYESMRDSIIRDIFVFGLSDPRMRENLLKESKLELRKAVNIARAIEKSKEQSLMISQKHEEINKI